MNGHVVLFDDDVGKDVPGGADDCSTGVVCRGFYCEDVEAAGEC